MDFTSKKVLIVYFSKKGENWYINGLKDLSKGNTEILAEKISKLAKGDLFEIVTKQPYPYGYDDCCRVAKAEWLCGIIGLPEADADLAARSLAARLY